MILVDTINNLYSSTKPKKTKKNRKNLEKSLTGHSANELPCGRQQISDAFKSGIFPIADLVLVTILKKQ